MIGAADAITMLVMVTPALAGAAMGVVATREILQAHRAVKAAETRAALLHTALVQERQKRSQAVSKGNRTRAERQRQKVLETAAAVQAAVEQKKLPPQGNLPLALLEDVLLPGAVRAFASSSTQHDA